MYVWGKCYLCARCMSQVVCPIHLEPQVVIRVNHLMGHRVLQVSLVFHLVCADQNAILRIEAACFPVRAAAAVDVVAVEIAAQLADVVAEEADNGALRGSVLISLEAIDHEGVRHHSLY